MGLNLTPKFRKGREKEEHQKEGERPFFWLGGSPRKLIVWKCHLMLTGPLPLTSREWAGGRDGEGVLTRRVIRAVLPA